MEEVGTCTIQRKWDESRKQWTTRVTQADPRIRISRELVNAIDNYDIGSVAISDSVLTIRDDYGARFIYRIHWHDCADGGYLAEWPD